VLRTYTRHRPASSKHEHAELLLRSNDRNWLKWRLLPKRDAANGVPISIIGVSYFNVAKCHIECHFSMWHFVTFLGKKCDKMPH
jgi:hypothetical protein